MLFKAVEMYVLPVHAIVVGLEGCAGTSGSGGGTHNPLPNCLTVALSSHADVGDNFHESGVSLSVSSSIPALSVSVRNWDAQ